MTDISLTLERTFAVPRDLMWQLWTTPEHLAQWMRPSQATFALTDATADVRPGGAWRFAMANDEGTWVSLGEYVEVLPIDKLVFTWQWEGGDENSLVTVTFSDDGDGTRVSLFQSRFADQPSADRHAEGWTGCLTTLAEIYSANPAR